MSEKEEKSDLQLSKENESEISNVDVTEKKEVESSLEGVENVNNEGNLEKEQEVKEEEVSYDKKKGSISVKSFIDLAKEGETLAELKKIYGNFILERNTILFPSERGVGKTFFSLLLAIVVAEGYSEFLGEKIELHGNTLYINMELGEGVLMRRLAKLYESVVKKEGNTFQPYCITDRRSLNQILPEIEKWVTKHDPVLVIIDNLRNAFSDSDNERNKEMTKAITQLNDLRDKHGFALLLVHHTKKGTASQITNSDMQSGAGAISDLIDGDFFLRRSQKDTNFRILKRAKSRNCEDQEGAKLLSFNPETLWFDLEEENVEESDHIFFVTGFEDGLAEQKKEAVKLRGEGKTYEEIGKALGKHKATVSRWFKDKKAA
jgi:RecA-family ATPase